MAMKILVTGGAGYIGTVLVPLLLEHGHQVTVLDSLRFGIGPILPMFRHPRFNFVRTDIRDRQSLAEHARTADAFIHLAAIVGYPACAQDPAEATAINVEGSANLAAVVGRGRPVVLASSGSCYGAVSEGFCTEDTPLRPLSLYGQTKAQAETLLLDQCEAIVYRLATAFGVSPRLRLDLLVNDFVYRAIHEHRLTVYEGDHRRSFIHVYDIARAILLALDHSAELAGRVLNVGDERHNCTKLEMCRVIQQVVPGLVVEAAATGQDIDRRDYAVSYARIAALGFRSTISLTEGVRDLARVLPWIDRREPFGNVSQKIAGS
jgi:nucleoside-diphosphate-sugar epimerase